MGVRKGVNHSRGATRMREQGRKLVAVWLDTNETAILEAAAKRLGMKLATYIRQRAFLAANAELKHR